MPKKTAEWDVCVCGKRVADHYGKRGGTRIACAKVRAPKAIDSIMVQLHLTGTPENIKRFGFKLGKMLGATNLSYQLETFNKS